MIELAGLLKVLKEVAVVPLIVITIGFATALILFSPPSMAEVLGIETFRSTYRTWIGIAFVLSVSCLVAQLVLWLQGIWKSRRKRMKLTKARQKHLHELTNEEKNYLRNFVEDGVTSLKSHLGSGLAGGLEAKGIIFRASSFGDPLYGFSYNIQPWAREYLQGHPELLEVKGAPAKESSDEGH